MSEPPVVLVERDVPLHVFGPGWNAGTWAIARTEVVDPRSGTVQRHVTALRPADGAAIVFDTYG